MTLYHSPYTKAFLELLDLKRTSSGKLGKKGRSSTGWYNEYVPRRTDVYFEIHATSFNENNIKVRKRAFKVNIWLASGLEGLLDIADNVPAQTLYYLASIGYPPAVSEMRKRLIDEVLEDL